MVSFLAPPKGFFLSQLSLMNEIGRALRKMNRPIIVERGLRVK